MLISKKWVRVLSAVNVAAVSENQGFLYSGVCILTSSRVLS